MLALSIYNSHAAILVHTSQAGLHAAAYTTYKGDILKIGAMSAAPSDNQVQQAEEEETKQPAKRRRKGGWPGVISLITGILSLVLWPALIPAIVFGVIGIKPDRKHRNRAETGLIFAGIAVVLAIVFLVIGAFPVLAF